MGGDTESPFFYAKDRGGYERKSDMETSYLTRGITMPFRTARQLTQTKGILCLGLGGRRHSHSALKETKGRL